MYVKRIEFAGFRRASRQGGRKGSVVLVADGTRMQIPLSLPRQLELRQSRSRLLLLAKAIREARRLPEFRRAGALRFAPGLLPPELTRA